MGSVPGRDLIVHLTLADGFKAINNIRASGSSFLLSTTFPTVKENKELRNQKDGFGWRPVNLSILPYSLGGTTYYYERRI